MSSQYKILAHLNDRLLRLLLTLPVSTGSIECAFSTLKIIKIGLCNTNTMKDEFFLQQLASIYVYKLSKMTPLRLISSSVTALWIHICKLYPYEHLWRLSRQILEIKKVTTCTSLSTETSPTTECTTSLNLRLFAHMESRTQDLRCYRGSCNYYATGLSWRN